MGRRADAGRFRPAAVIAPTLAAVLALLLVATVGGCKEPIDGAPPVSGQPTAVAGYPSSMAALGDSITLAEGACLVPAPCLRSSWATGDGPRIDSHYRRIVRVNPAMQGHASNFAALRATSADLAGQASSAADVGAEYVTILIGANDVCHAGISDMTAPRVFRSRIDQALNVLSQRLPSSRVLVLSVPDVYRLWQVGHTRKSVTAVWNAVGVCPALLANPTSTAKADADRRQAFRDRIKAYNEQLSAACSAHRRQCRYDRGAVNRTEFGLDKLNVADFFHPNGSGQNLLARVSYPERFNW